MSTNSFKIKNSAVLTPKDLSTLVSPEAGEIACDINDSNKIKRYDAASSSWVEVGSGGVGSVDIMFVQDFESASLSSFTQTGLELSTTNPLHGKVSALITHQAAINQSFKQVIPVDPKFRGQAMVLDLNVKSAASAGNVVIKVRDESAPADLIVSEALQLSNDVSGRRSSVSFTIPSTCSSLSYTITALPEAGSPVTRIDDIVAMLSDVSLLETSVLVPNMTAWQGYTPTFQGFGTPSNVEFEWRQVGENVEIRGKFTAGTPTAVEARVGLPNGLTSAGTSLIPSIQLVGNYTRSANAAESGCMLIEPSVSYLTIGTQYSASGGLTKQLANGVIGPGNTVSFFASVPCAGLSATSTKTIPLTQSGLVQNADGNLQINGFTPANGSINTCIMTIASGSIAKNIGDHIVWNPSATLGDTFTATKSGIYTFNFSSDTGSVAKTIGFSKNSTQLTTAVNSINTSDKLNLTTDSGNSTSSLLSWTGSLVAGDVIRIHNDTGAFTSASTTYSAFSCSYQGSLKQVSVSSDQKITIPTSELRFEGASAKGTGAEAATVQFQSLAKLRGDAFSVSNSNGTIITILKKGKLSVSASLITTAAASFAITKNQATNNSFSPTVSEIISNTTTVTPSFNASVSGEIDVLAGDIIRVSTGGTPNSSIFCNFNLSFQEQDISVSVTNTLPQFSESDSSVRVNTANGYGSTASNKIRRFSSVVDNIGTDISYVDDPANGATFTVLTSGVYNVTYTDQFSAQCLMGLSKNASSLTSAIQSLSASQILATTNSVSLNQPESVSWQGYLNAGDIIRPHSEGTSAGTTTSAVNFTISKVGKPNVTGVNVTPFVNVPQPESQSNFIGQNLSVGVATITGSLQTTRGSGIYSYNSSTGIYTLLKAAKVELNISARSASATAAIPAIQVAGVTRSLATSLALTGAWASCSHSEDLQAGTTFNFANLQGTTDQQQISVVVTAASSQILTAPESFSTDTASLSYASSAAYTLSTLQNAPVGTYITFTTASGGNTHTQTTTAPSQSPADMNINGINIFSRARNTPSTAGNPARIAIQIGKGLKGLSLRLYKSTGKVNTGSLDFEVIDSAVQTGMMFKEYNEVTGILLLDSSTCWNSTNTSNSFNFSDFTQQTSGYLVINASKSPALTGVPAVLPRIATLSDVKAANTAGGTATAGSYQTRTLNTLSDPTGIVTSLASNQFTLPAGEYYIEASAPGFSVDYHRAKIRNITDSSDVLLGTTEFSINSAFYATSSSKISGNIVISSPKVFELQHRVTFTRATNGFGGAANIGDNELFSIVKITKVK